MAAWRNMEIAMIGVLAEKFPQLAVLHWMALRDCVTTLRGQLYDLNRELSAIEDDADLSPQGMARKRADAAVNVLKQLDSFDQLTKAKAEVAKRLGSLNKTMALPPIPANVPDAMLAAEIRAHVARQERPELWVMNQQDPRILGAVISAPSVLSGMSDADVARAKDLWMNRQHPDQLEEQQKLNAAVGICEQALESAKRLIESRAQLRQDIDGVWRHNSEQAPLVA